jgi:hypothetical protein
MSAKRSHYKIRRRSDGLFSSGGCYVYFDSEGKIWHTIGAARGAITHARNYSHGEADPYAECDIIEFELQPIATTAIPPRN